MALWRLVILVESAYTPLWMIMPFLANEKAHGLGSFSRRIRSIRRLARHCGGMIRHGVPGGRCAIWWV